MRGEIYKNVDIYIVQNIVASGMKRDKMKCILYYLYKKVGC